MFEISMAQLMAGQVFKVRPSTLPPRHLGLYHSAVIRDTHTTQLSGQDDPVSLMEPLHTQLKCQCPKQDTTGKLSEPLST